MLNVRITLSNKFNANFVQNFRNMKSLLKKQAGFTIVEVMIVIGIGALIIVLVLVAAPALQRNARNTQRRNDVNSLKAQLLTVTNNANGVYPDLNKFNTDVLAQIKPSIYKATGAGNAVATPANCGTTGTWTDAAPTDGIVQMGRMCSYQQLCGRNYYRRLCRLQPAN